MEAKEYFESQLITDSKSVIDKTKHKFTSQELIKFAEAYATSKQVTDDILRSYNSFVNMQYFSSGLDDLDINEYNEWMRNKLKV